MDEREDKFVTITIEVDAELADKARVVLEKQGYTLEDAIALFLKAVARSGKIPFAFNTEEESKVKNEVMRKTYDHSGVYLDSGYIRKSKKTQKGE